MKKTKFGTREVIIATIFIVVYVLLEWLQRYMMSAGVLSEMSYFWIKSRVIIVAIASAILGPLVGSVIAVGGAVLVNMIFYGYISYMEIVAYILAAYIIGRYYEHYHVHEGGFRGQAIIDFNIIQIFSNIICGIMLCPLLIFLTERIDLLETVRRGAMSTLGNSIATAIVGTLILYIVSWFYREK